MKDWTFTIAAFITVVLSVINFIVTDIPWSLWETLIMVYLLGIAMKISAKKETQ